MAAIVDAGQLRRRRRQAGVLADILAVCPAAVDPVARALHVRMPMQNGGGRDDISEAGVLIHTVLISFRPPLPPLLSFSLALRKAKYAHFFYF